MVDVPRAQSYSSQDPSSILQPGSGPVRARHYVAASPDTVLWGRLPCALDAPVATVDPGEAVTIDTVSHEGILEDQGRDPIAFFAAHGVRPEQVLQDAVGLARSFEGRDPTLDGPHVVTGPIRIRGAEPGDLLKTTVLETLPRVPYGVISNRHGRGALPGEFPRRPGTVSVFAALDPDEGRDWAQAGFAAMAPRAGAARSLRFPVAPFLGIMGVATAGRERAHSVPPGPHGGNLDIRLLTAGSALYLPVQVPGALAYVGDPHFAQGDGEVALTALEASLRVTVRFDVIEQAEAIDRFGHLAGALAETADYLIPTGLDPDLDEAMRRCVRAAVSLLQARFAMDPEHALAYLSAATDFNVSQVVDLVTGVHARIRIADFSHRTAAAPPAPAALGDALVHGERAPRGDAAGGPVTRIRQRGAEKRRRIRAAQVSDPGPAADPRIWRLLGFPLVAPTASGVLDGESVAVKDLFAVAGFPVGAGNPAYLAEADPEPAHADAVRALLDAGARVRGIARTDEFAYSIAGTNAHYGTPPNPRAPRHLPGGSSNGPASAVAMGHVSIGLGTDTAGSIRVPASYQGLWGLRSTHGAVSREGLLALAPSFDTVGWLTRSPEVLVDAARVSLPAAVQTAGAFVLCPALLEPADPLVRSAFTKKISMWIHSGVIPEPRTVKGPDPQAAFNAFRVVQAAEAWRTHGAWIRRHPDALGADLAARFAWAATVTADEERAARRALDAIRAHLEAALEDDILLLPATPACAPLRGANTADLDAARAATIGLTCLAAITGRPALSAPYLRADGAPVGLSLIGPRGSDLDIVARAAALAG